MRRSECGGVRMADPSDTAITRALKLEEVRRGDLCHARSHPSTSTVGTLTGGLVVHDAQYWRCLLAGAPTPAARLGRRRGRHAVSPGRVGDPQVQVIPPSSLVREIGPSRRRRRQRVREVCTGRRPARTAPGLTGRRAQAGRSQIARAAQAALVAGGSTPRARPSSVVPFAPCDSPFFMRAACSSLGTTGGTLCAPDLAAAG